MQGISSFRGIFLLWHHVAALVLVDRSDIIGFNLDGDLAGEHSPGWESWVLDAPERRHDLLTSGVRVVAGTQGSVVSMFSG